MYKNILLLLDCSDVDKVILDHISELAKLHNSKVELYHVVHAHTLDQERILSEKAEIFLSSALKFLHKKQVNAVYTIGEGEPEEEVLKKARDQEWDLIAMATHGHKALGDFLYGSVSNTLKHKIKIPILTIKGKLLK